MTIPSAAGTRPRRKHKKSGLLSRAAARLAGLARRCASLLAAPERPLSFADEAVVDAWGAGDLLPVTGPAETGQLPALDLPVRSVPDVAGSPQGIPAVTA